MHPFQFIKHILVAHEHNDHTPHLLRELSLGSIILFGVFLLGVSLGSSLFLKKTVLGASIAASVLVDMTNESRLAYNVTPLVRSEKLDHAAELKATDMSAKSYFSHNSPQGVTPWHWFKEVGYTFVYAGENLAIDFTESREVQNAWLASPLHKENILNVNFQEIGIATMEGVYNNRPTIFVVQMFGTPAFASQKQIDTVPGARKSPTLVGNTKSAIEEPDEGRGIVKGQSSLIQGSNQEVIGVSSLAPVITMYETKELAVVKNEEAYMALEVPTKSIPTYSSWYERVIFGITQYADLMYKGFLLLILFSLCTMLFVEYRKEHWQHISYALGAIVVLMLLLFINNSLF